MPSKCSKIISHAANNSISMCNPPPPFMSQEVCYQLMAMKNNIRNKARKEAEQSKYNGINSTLVDLVKKIGLTPEQIRENTLKNLKSKWDSTAKVEKNAPQKTFDAEHAYYKFKVGESGWKDLLLKKYTNIANNNKEEALKIHKAFINQLDTLTNDYKGEIESLVKIKELLKIRLNENDSLKSAIDSQEATTQTNDRRVVYEVWAKGWLGTIKSLLTTIYVILAIVYLVWGPFLEQSQYKTLVGWLKPLILFVLPFTIYYIVQFFYFIKSKIAWYLDNKASKDVYLNLNK